MGVSLARQKGFRTPRQQEQVLHTFKREGMAPVMKAFDIKTRRAAEKLLKDIGLNHEFNPDSPLAHLRGGEKHQWLRQHRQTVLDCLDIFGKDFVQENFNMESDTLAELKESPPPSWRKQTHMENAEIKAFEALRIVEALEKKVDGLEIAIERLRQSNKENIQTVRELEKLLS